MTRHSTATSVRISDCSKTSYRSTSTVQTEEVATLRTIPSSSKSIRQQQQPAQQQLHRSTSQDTSRHSYIYDDGRNTNDVYGHEDECGNNNDVDDRYNEHNNTNEDGEQNDSSETSDNEYDSEEEDEDDARNRSTCAMLAGANMELNDSTCTNNNGTIGLFGIYSRTGNHFLRLALDAGYSVRVFLLPSASIIDPSTKTKKTITSAAIQDEFSNTEETLLKWIPAKRFNDKHAMQRTIKNVDYVVCMLSDTVYTDADNSTVMTPAQKRRSRTSSIGGAGGRNSVGSTSKSGVVANNTKGRKVGILTEFIQTLYPLMMNMSTIQVFLYQATSLANNTINGSAPILSHLFKSVAQVAAGSKTSSFLYDQDMVMNEIALQHHYKSQHQTTNDITSNAASIQNSKKTGNSQKNSNAMEDEENENPDVNSSDKEVYRQPHFSYIVTRPTSLINDVPSTKKLAPTKSVRYSVFGCCTLSFSFYFSN
jgi:hypothetical protein